MNVQNKIIKTAAEEALIEQFSNSLGSLPGSTVVVSGRDRNFAALMDKGLPTRRVESWHYTDLRKLLQNIPALSNSDNADAVATLVAGSKLVSILNGKVASIPSLPKGIEIEKFSEQLENDTVDAVFAETTFDDAIGQFNSAFVKDGLAIKIAEDADVKELVELQFAQSEGQMHSRLPVTFAANSKATIIERHISVSDAQSLVTSVVNLKLEEGAHARWIIVQCQGASDTHLGQINIDLAANCELELYVVNAGGKVVRQEIIAKVDGSDTNLTLRGVNLLAGDTHTDVTLKLGHNQPNTNSDETFRNVLYDNAKGVFQGQIKVAQIAQKTDAQMACNTLLLSDDADFSAKPELEIFADDVICAHGATVTDIDPAQLFYLMARGVTEKTARGLLVKGFVAEVVEEFDDEAVVEALEGIITDWLNKNG